MGSLFSAPPIPTIPFVQSAPPSTSVNPVSIERPLISDPDNNDEVVKDVIRRASRGRSSTIQTSFRGVLGQSNQLAPQRKILLGE